MPEVSDKSSNLGTTSGTAVNIFEDHEVRVIFQPGTSDFLLITFGDLSSLADGNRFFADVPVQKLGLNCVGFMAKTQNWFPIQSMESAIKSIKEFTQKFSKRLVYGGSMGGYAAIKYSRRLDASAVISMCPQWSIDKKECKGTDPGWQNYFRPYMDNMGITKHDLSGIIYLLYDSNNKTDAFHASEIVPLSHNIKQVVTRSTDHHVTTIMAGTENLKGLIQCALQSDHEAMINLAGLIRRKHPTRQRILLTKLSLRHPSLLDRILTTNNRKISEEDLTLFNSRILSSALAVNDTGTAISTITRMTNLNICPGRKTTLHLLCLELSYNRVFTYHKSSLAYNPITGLLIHKPQDQKNIGLEQLIPIRTLPLGDAQVLGVLVAGEIYYILIRQNKSVALVNELEAKRNPRTSLIVQYSQDGMQVRYGEQFISAEINGNVSYNRTVAKGWETFRASI